MHERTVRKNKGNNEPAYYKLDCHSEGSLAEHPGPLLPQMKAYKNFIRQGFASVSYPVLVQVTIIIYHNGDLLTPLKPPYLVIIYFLHVTEPVTGEIILHEFKKPDFLGKERIFVLLGFTGEIEALVIRDNRIILPVLVKSGELPPVDIPVFVRFPVEHKWINPTDSKTVVVDPAPSVFQKPAGLTVIILCPYCIPRDIKYAVLVAKFGCRCRFDCSRIKCSY
jgi:hypothetical protein